MNKPLSLITAAMCLFAALAAPAGATVLTFDIYTDSDKNTLLSNTFHQIQSYGDNVTDFSPAGASTPEGYFYNYGSAGGVTPDVTVQYWWYSTTNPNDVGLTSMGFANTGFGDLTNTINSPQPSPYWIEIRFTPTNGKTVSLDSFDMAGLATDQTLEHLAVVQDFNTGSDVTLFGPLTSTVLSGTTHNHFAPGVSVATGHTLSLVFGRDTAERGIDNITFSVPEPASAAVLGLGALALLPRRRRGYLPSVSNED